MPTEVIGDGLEDVLGQIGSDDDSDRLLVDPSPTMVEEITQLLYSDNETINILAQQDTLKEALSDFRIAARAVDLIEEDRIDLRIVDQTLNNTLLLTPSSMATLLRLDSRLNALVTTDEELMERTRSMYQNLFADARSYDVHTPAYSEVQTSLREAINQEMEQDYIAALESSSSLDNPIDEVAIGVLVAARNGELQYELSAWGEKIGIASRATFSRTKSQLEDEDLITTEKVPIDVGRPRYRLQLENPQLSNIPVEEIGNAARELIEDK
ncbi:transcriptional regulator TbsP domain-containing protein [Halopenitus persicus]|nr:DUF5821 family protein [Halopenitus persicus]